MSLLHVVVHPAYVYFAIDPALVARRTPHFSHPTRAVSSAAHHHCAPPLVVATTVDPRGRRGASFDASFVSCVSQERGTSGGSTLSTAPGLILAWRRGERSVETVGRLADDVGATPPAPRRRLAPFPRAGAPPRKGDEEGRCPRAEVGRGSLLEGTRGRERVV